MLHLMSPRLKKRKDICYNILELITEKLINEESSKEDFAPLSKDEDNKEDREESLHEDNKQEISNHLPQDWTITKDHR